MVNYRGSKRPYGLVPPPPREPTEAEVAYVAGLYEGEGSCQKVKRYRRMTIRMTDKEPLDLVQQIMGGIVAGPYRDVGVPDHYKDKWAWRVGAWRDILRIVPLIRPWLSPRRQAQVDRLLEDIPAHPRGILICPDVPYASTAPYERHRKLGIPPCEKCMESLRLYNRALQAKRRERKQLETPDHAKRD
jgi:hypothetical protein